MMPRSILPPTPASSTDIKGKDGTEDLASLQLAFELPPPAVAQDPALLSPKDIRTSPKALLPASSTSTKDGYPMQAAETVKSRRRASSSAQKAANAPDAFALPPPPTRSRKIIQMKPRLPSTSQSDGSFKETPSAVPQASTPSTKAVTSTGKETTSKKKQPSASSAAGRKIARKTAHSLIERRRRSKMNEEFSVLKNMIPACNGEMHKLAILQVRVQSSFSLFRSSL